LKTIFIVDDSDTNLATAEEALEDHYNVMTVPSAAKMFTLLEKLKPGLILLDIEMPEMNGFEAIERLKTGASWADIPVIFLTGTADKIIEDKGLNLGAVGVVTKPFSTPVLLELINRHIK
jgi:putative two-component system response regulator